MEPKYRVLEYDEMIAGGFDECESVLVGPDSFECSLDQPEDRRWTRNGAVVVAELNRLLTELETARAKIVELREALAAAKLFGNDGETHEGKSVSYMIEKALTGTAGRSGE